jgi:hypothetical protein
MKKLMISSELITSFLTTGVEHEAFRIQSGLPADCVLSGARVLPEGILELYFRHPSFLNDDGNEIFVVIEKRG